MNEDESHLGAERELESTLRLSADLLKTIFRILNKFMVGMFRVGLGPYIGNPYTGYVMVLTTTGRKSGLRRHTPVNYALRDGEVYCLAGFGRKSDWYRNLLANPKVQLWIEGDGWTGHAEVMTDPTEWLPVYREILRRAGFADGIFTKKRWSDLSDEELLRIGKAAPAIRIRLEDRLPRSEGPGDLRQLWPVVGAGLLAGWLAGRARRRKQTR